jgi:hypothetical protein
MLGQSETSDDASVTKYEKSAKLLRNSLLQDEQTKRSDDASSRLLLSERRRRA